jgi:NitT/TauT family transport system substrate-binding protein
MIRHNGLSRRTLIRAAGAGLAAAAVGMPAIVRAQSPVRIGYLHTLAVDGQLWLADHMGFWAEQGLAPEFTQFTTGLELFQAMIGGSIDMLTTGAVISNFPARGQGKMFMCNCVEFATAQLWVNPDAGVASFEDLKGKQISTTTGTTAHVFLANALKANNLAAGQDVEIVNQRMSEAVTSFISGAVPAVALWVPFNIAVRNQLPNAKMLVDASAYYPEAAIVSGWAAENSYFAQNAEIVKKVIQAWVPANDFLVAKPDEAVTILQEKYYQQVPLADLKEQMGAQRVFPSQEWAELFKDGTVTGWLQQVTDFYVSVGGIDNPVPASEYFDPSLYIEVVGG